LTTPCCMFKLIGSKFSSIFSLDGTRSRGDDSPTVESIAGADAFLWSWTAAISTTEQVRQYHKLR
jgi:hypothetical protein